MASRQGPTRPRSAADRRPGLGLPFPRPADGSSRRQEGRRARGFPREGVELRRRHARMPRDAGARRGTAAGDARTRGWLAIRERLPQIEVAVGDTGADRAGVSRPRTANGGRPGAASRVQRRARPRGLAAAARPGFVEPVPGTSPRALGYGLPEFGLWLPFSPTEFTQVNAGVNRVMVARAVSLLAPAPDDASPTCSVAWATSRSRWPRARAASSGSTAPCRWSSGPRPMRGTTVRRAQRPDHVCFQVADLFGLDEARWQALGPVDRWLIDPPRDGALAVARTLATTPAPPKRVVYVSCNPATLARDVAILVHGAGAARFGRGGQHVPSDIARRVDRRARASPLRMTARSRRMKKGTPIRGRPSGPLSRAKRLVAQSPLRCPPAGTA